MASRILIAFHLHFTRKEVSKMKAKRIAAGLVTCLIASSISVASAPEAYAVYNCNVSFNASMGWQATCSLPTNTSYRIHGICENKYTHASREVTGNWVTTGSGIPSTLDSCGLFESVYGTPWASEG